MQLFDTGVVLLFRPSQGSFQMEMHIPRCCLLSVTHNNGNLRTRATGTKSSISAVNMTFELRVLSNVTHDAFQNGISKVLTLKPPCCSSQLYPKTF